MESNITPELKEKIEALQTILDNGRRIVFFGGAGVSTESGIPDFRSADGLYHQKYKYNPETILSHSLLFLNPMLLRLDGQLCYIQVVTAGKHIRDGVCNILREQAGGLIRSEIRIAVQVCFGHVRKQGSNLDAVFPYLVKETVGKA